MQNRNAMAPAELGCGLVVEPDAESVREVIGAAESANTFALKVRIARYLEGCGYTSDAASTAAAKYSGHSGRVGMYTAASEAVAAHARHNSINVAQKYARKADQLKRAPSKNPALAI
jgi:hypothetical protein